MIRALRAPDHGRPYDWPYPCDVSPAEPASVTVYPADDEPEVALYGPGGEPLRWHVPRRPVGYRRLTEDDL